MGPLTEKIFIQRIRDIIKQYKDNKSNYENEYYDVTLLFNCLLGLIVMPTNPIVNKTIGNLIDRDLNQDIKSTVLSANDIKGETINIKLKEYINGLRNGIAHQELDVQSLFSTDENNNITSINITGLTNGRNNIIKYQFNVNNGELLEKVINEILSFLYPAVFNPG